MNCEPQANPSGKLSISSECPDKACKSTILYSWSLFFLESQRGKTQTWQRVETPNISSSVSFPSMVIKSNSLQGNKQYKLVVMGFLPDGIYGRASYTFQVNAPPTDGECYAKPRVGYVLTTHYKVWCTGWHDPDAPLKYEVIHVQGTLETLLYYGGDAGAIVSLPLGDGQNYTINITVRVSDRLGSAALVRLQVQVLSRSSTQYCVEQGCPQFLVRASALLLKYKLLTPLSFCYFCLCFSAFPQSLKALS